MRSNTKKLVRSALFLAIAVIFQMVGKNQPFVGPVVNAILLLTAFYCGTILAVCVGILTPALALVSGVLPAPLGPFVPFIAAGNALFVICFGLFKNYGRIGGYISIAAGAVVKYIFLYFSATKIATALKLGIPQKVMKNLAIMMGTPQLVNALIGGVIAIVIIEILRKRVSLD
ncbi:MAG: ECF transporter S component [Clostridium sp.]|nr:ECF transporter S component [Clostridium sp.]